MVSTLRRFFNAHTLAPFPRCATITRPSAISGGDFRRRFGQHAGDVFVRQAVKAIALHAETPNLLRKRNDLGDGGLATVEACVEAGDLRDARHALGHGLDRGEIVRLMERRQRHERLQVREHLRLNARDENDIDNDNGNHYLQAEAIIAKLMHHYNEERLRAALGYMAPAPGIVDNRIKFEMSVRGELLRPVRIVE